MVYINNHAAAISNTAAYHISNAYNVKCRRAYKFKEYLFAGNSVVVTVNCKYN